MMRLDKKGSRYRVVRAGSRLSRWVASRPNCHSVQDHHLQVGDVIDFTGRQPGFGSDPGPHEPWFRLIGDDVIGAFNPQGGMWDTNPVDGFLQPLEDEACETDAATP